MYRFALSLLLLSAMPAFAAQSLPDSKRPFEITDNSFLVEEAFNQEAGVFQNILLVQRPRPREWSFEFTQEWPLGGPRHQLSYTIPVEAVKERGADGYDVGRGTFALHYRLQLMDEGTGPAVSPRLSLLIPDFPDSDAHFGVQLNLPASKQLGDFYVHANAGYTWNGIASVAGRTRHASAAGSVIYRARPMLHLMVETLLRGNEYGPDESLLVAPGFRAGWNLGDRQLVAGVAVPVGILEQDESVALLLYFSYELPFKRRQ